MSEVIFGNGFLQLKNGEKFVKRLACEKVEDNNIVDEKCTEKNFGKGKCKG